MSHGFGYFHGVSARRMMPARSGAIGAASLARAGATSRGVPISGCQHARRRDRRPARNDLPPRRMRATVPAHSKPECTGVFLWELDELIKQNSPGAGESPSGKEHAPPIPCLEPKPDLIRPTRGHPRQRRPDTPAVTHHREESRFDIPPWNLGNLLQERGPTHGTPLDLQAVSPSYRPPGRTNRHDFS